MTKQILSLLLLVIYKFSFVLYESQIEWKNIKVERLDYIKSYLV